MAQDSEKQGFWSRVAEKLQRILRFASSDEVLALCKKRLKYDKLPPEELLENLYNLSFIQDCERIAQYLHTGTSKEVKQQICSFYRWEYTGYIEKQLMKKLIHYHNEIEAEIRMEGSRDFVVDKIFCEDAFGKVASQYKPPQGKTFEEFIKKQILWRSLDAAKNPGMSWEQYVEVDPVDLPQVIPSGINQHDQVKLRQALNSCLGNLSHHTDNKNEDIGIEERAVFELRYKVYVAPADMAPETLELVKRKSSCTIKELQKEYHSVLQEFKQLESVTLPEAEYRWNEASGIMQESRLQLDLLGYSTNQLDRLQEEALRRTLSDIQNELVDIKKTIQSNERLKELDYMVSYHRYDKAMKKMGEVRKNYHKSWERSQPQISKLLGIPQPTVFRRLESAKNFLQKCLRTKGVYSE